jgi:hypothetical protein
MRTERSKRMPTLLLAIALFVLASVTGYSQSYPTSITQIYPYSICYGHGPANPSALGSISVVGGGKADGIGWRVVRPNGQPITSGITPNTNLATHHLDASIGVGTLFRLETQGLGFSYEGKWATTSFFVKGDPSTLTSCGYFPCRIPTSSQLATLSLTAYDGSSNSLGLLSANLTIPARSTITVKYANGTPITNRSVFLSDYNYNYNNAFIYTVSTTNGSGQVSYHIPNQQNGKNVRGYFAVEDKGFLHLAPMDQDCSGGVARTIAVPLASTVTVSRITLPVSDRSVYVTDANIQTIFNDFDIKTNANGQATFSIALPVGTQFRFLIKDPYSDLYYYSNLLTASANGTNGSIIVVAQNMPLLLSPANAATFDDSTSVSFSWGYGMGDKYAWFCRHSSETNFTGYWATGTSLSAQFSPGTWEWFVQGYDAANNQLTQSATRSFTITGDRSSQAMSRNTGNAEPSVILPQNLTKIIDTHEAAPVVSEELAAQIAAVEAENEENEFDWNEFYPFDWLWLFGGNQD